MKRGMLIAPYSEESERMAYALVKSLRSFNAELPVLVLEQDYVGNLAWRGLAECRPVRALEPHRSPRQWFNKLSALARSPFGETLYLDCDVLLLSDPSPWFEALGTDDFKFFPTCLDPELVPDRMQLNLVNPHRMREKFGLGRTAVIQGGGHFFLRKTDRAERMLTRLVEIMDEAMDMGRGSLYHRMTGEGNLEASDEPAASIMMAEYGVKLPEGIIRTPPGCRFLCPPPKGRRSSNLRSGRPSFIVNGKGDASVLVLFTFARTANSILDIGIGCPNKPTHPCLHESELHF